MRNTRQEPLRGMSQHQGVLPADLIETPSAPEEELGSYPDPSEGMDEHDLFSPAWDEEVVQESHRKISTRASRAASGRQL